MPTIDIPAGFSRPVVPATAILYALLLFLLLSAFPAFLLAVGPCILQRE